jgi:putative transposase
MTADFCLDALKAATGLRAPGDPEHRPGQQFTGTAFVDVVQQHGIHLSMDGRGAWRDNLFVERPWKSVKSEGVYLCICMPMTR